MGKEHFPTLAECQERLNQDPQAVLDEAMARLGKRLGKLPKCKPEVGKIAAAVRSGTLGPNPLVVEMVTNWRRQQMGTENRTSEE